MNNAQEIDSLSAETLYNPLMNYYIHQNSLMWNRLQTVLVVQGAILFASLRSDDPISFMALVLGACFTFATYIFMTRDRKIRDQIETSLYELGGVRLNTSYRSWASSRHFVPPLYWGFIVIDMLGALRLSNRIPKWAAIIWLKINCLLS